MTKMLLLVLILCQFLVFQQMCSHGRVQQHFKDCPVLFGKQGMAQPNARAPPAVPALYAFKPTFSLLVQHPAPLPRAPAQPSTSTDRLTPSDLHTRIELHQDVVRLQVSVRYPVSNEMVHAFQQLQNHHAGQTAIRAVVPQVLAQGARIASENMEDTSISIPGALPFPSDLSAAWLGLHCTQK